MSYLRALRTPTVEEKAAKLMRRFADLFPVPGKLFTVLGPDRKSPDVLPYREAMATAWAANDKELKYLIGTYLAQHKGFLLNVDGKGAFFHISPAGWEYLGNQPHAAASQSAFVAMWFDPALHPVWLEAIEPGIEDAGYGPVRIDRVEHNNRIDDEIEAGIRACKFLVADFTGQRGGVYYEAGLAKGLGRPVVWLCRKDELPQVHFDNRQYNFIDWNPDDLPELRNRLKNRIEATLGKGGFLKSGSIK